MKKSPINSTPFQKRAFLVYLVAVSAGTILLLWDFLMPLFLAAIFTGITYPLYKRILRKVRRPVTSALFMIILLVLLLVLPFIAIAAAAYQQAAALFNQIDLRAGGEKLLVILNQLQHKFPRVFEKIDTEHLSKMATEGAQNSAQLILKHSAGISLSLANNVLSFFLMLFIMFYFYIDGLKILKHLSRWSPLKDEYELILLGKFLSVSKGTLKGFLVIGIVQGIIGMILFWATGLHSPIFLGVLMIFASLIPVLGTAMVWGPVAIYFLVQGHWIITVWILFVGGVVISSVDNFIRPRVVGKDIKMHDLMVLLSTLGGIGLFGLVGFILGPIIAALFLSMWNIFEEVFAEELSVNHKGMTEIGKKEI